MSVDLSTLNELQHRGDYQAALRACRRMLERTPSDWQIYDRALILESLLGLPSRSRRTMEEARRNASAFDFECREAQTLLTGAVFLDRLGCFDHAVSLLEKGLRRFPESRDLRVRLADICLWLGRYPAASGLAAELLRLAPGDAEGLRLRAAVRVLDGEPREAALDLSAALESGVEDPAAALAWRGEALRLMGRGEEALADLRRARTFGAFLNEALIVLDTKPSEPGKAVADIHRAFYNLLMSRSTGDPRGLKGRILAWLRRIRGNRTIAVTFAQEDSPRAPIVRWERPRDHIAWLRLLQTRIRGGNALDVFRAFDRIKPRMLERQEEHYWLSHQGEVCLWVGRYDEAERNLKRALALRPSSKWPHTGLAGVRLLKYRDPKGALEHISLARANGCSDKVYKRWEGESYRQMGLHSEALRCFEAVLDTRPPQPAVWINYGLASAALGDSGKLARAFTVLSEIAGHFLEQARAALELDSGGSLSDDERRRVLERALEMMKGNRSSRVCLYFDETDRPRNIYVAPLPAG